jgi:hypothetical protein
MTLGISFVISKTSASLMMSISEKAINVYPSLRADLANCHHHPELGPPFWSFRAMPFFIQCPFPLAKRLLR